MISKGLKIRAVVLSVLSSLVIGVAAISTMAWFTIQQPNLTNDFTTGSGSVTIDTENIYGYKKAATLDPNSKEMDYDASAIASRKLNAQDTKTNQGSEEVDTNFNVPTDGVGYYLVKGKPYVVDKQTIYKFPYVDNEVINYVKLSDIDRPQRAYANVSFDAGAHYRFMHYSFRKVGVTPETVNEKISIESSNLLVADGNVTVTGGDLVVTAAKDYKLWFNHAKGTVTLENGSGKIAPKSQNKPSKHVSHRNALVDGDFGTFIHLGTFFDGWGTMTEPKFYLNGVGGTDSPFSTNDDNFLYAPYNANSANSNELRFKIKQNGNQKYFHVASPEGGYKSGHYYRLDFESNEGFGNWSGDYAGRAFKATDITSSLKSVSVYIDFAWPQSWNPACNSPSIHAWGNNPILSETSQGMSLYEGTTYRYNLQFFDSINDIQFYCWQDSSRKSTIDLDASAFADGDNWEVELTQAWIGDKMGATLTEKGPSKDTNKIYIFDPLGLSSNGFAVYAYGDSATVAPASNQPWPGVPATADGTVPGLYSIDISESYGMFVINDGQTSTTVKTADFALSSYKGKYYVLNYKQTDDSGIFDNASWYETINEVSEETHIYYVYDKANKLGDVSNIHAYAWTENEHADGEGTYFYSYQNAEWPGVAVSATETPGLYSIEVSDTYEHIIFNNGSQTVQTVDEDIDTSTPYFILDGTSTTEGGIKKWGGSWMENLVGIELSCVYYYDSELVELPQGETYYLLGRDVTDGYSEYYPTLDVTAAVDYGDSSTGMFYRFQPQNGWLIKNESNEYEAYDTQVISSATKLYKKYLASSSDMIQMYVDINEANTKNGTNQWTGLTVLDNGGNKLLDNVGSKIATGNDYFYSVSLNKYAVSSFSLSNGMDPTGSNTIGDGSGATRGTLNLPATSGSYLYVFETDNGKTHTTGFLSESSSNVGTITLTVTPQGGSSRNYKMGSGDLTLNYAVYERGIEISENSTVSIAVSGAKSPYSAFNKTYNTRSDLDPESETGINAKYISSEETSIKIITAARYNFYLAFKDGDLKINIAQVPLLGNGTYIMKYTDSTNGYMNSYKMTDYNDDFASYSGFNINAKNETYYVRSYLNAVDTLYKTEDQFNVDPRLADKVSVDHDTGVITFAATGQYNISRNAAVISITSYSTDEFFSLKPIIGSSHTEIKNKNTSFVFEVPFTVDSPVQSRVALFANNPAENSQSKKILGFSLYVSDHVISKQSDEHLSPYDYMREYHYELSTGPLILDRSEIVFAGSSEQPYYAYILIDYVTTDVPSYVPSMPSFYLQLRQAN